jgi:hypothetical protein
VAATPDKPSSFRERLLPKPANALDADALIALQTFCRESPEVAAAYVGVTEREYEGKQPEQVLRLKVRLTWPVDLPGDSRDASLALAHRLAHSQPELMRQLGWGVLADRAVPTWDKNALHVFSR